MHRVSGIAGHFRQVHGSRKNRIPDGRHEWLADREQGGAESQEKQGFDQNARLLPHDAPRAFEYT